MSTELLEQTEPVQTPKKKKWPRVLLVTLVVLIAAAAIAAVAVWNANVFTLSLALKGDEEITLEYGQTYEEPGAQATFQGTLLLRDKTDGSVTIRGSVDTDTVGTYELTYLTGYYVDYFIDKAVFYQSAKRTVHVVDTQAPTITLTTNPDGYTVPGQPYTEEGYTAMDGYDGDLTDKVVRTEADGVVTYTVSDAAGNTASAQRPIRYHDPVAPTITLKGDSSVSMYQGNTYKEAGYTAADNLDGDLTSKVVVTGSVNTAKAGTYTLTYTVTDSYNNTVSVKRTVTVKSVPQIPEMPKGDYTTPVTPNGKVIYLTFDDGPSKHTSKLLDVLAKYNVKATFFVCKTGYLSILPRIAAEGHTLAMHSATHTYKKIYASESAYFNDLKTIQNLITKYTGQTPTLVRFPGGSSNTVSRFNPGIMTRLVKELDKIGYRYFDWNVDSGDATNAIYKLAYEDRVSKVYSNVVNGISKRSVSVVLQHDIKGFSVDAVESIIKWGLAHGYTFKALDSSSPVCAHRINN